MSRAKDELIHRLHDGDLDGEARAAAERELSPEDRERVAALDELGALMRNTFAAGSEGFDVSAQVMRGLPAPVAAARARRLRFGARAAWGSGLLFAAAAAAFLLMPGKVAPASFGCQIESIEVSGAQATVLETDDGSGGAGTVVWIDEEES